MGFETLGKNVLISDKASIYGANQMRIGDNCRIDDFCVVSGRVEMGRNVYVGPFALIAGGTPGVFLDDFATLAYRVQIFSQSDDYSGETMTNPTVPVAYKNETKIPTYIGRHVIIGAGSTVMPGADLAEGTSLGSATLVLRSTDPWSIYVGNPARKLKDRDRGLLRFEEAYIKAQGKSN